MGPCPACDASDARILFRSTDRLFHTTSQEFSIIECAGCGLIRLHPWPPPHELRRYYPPNYWFNPEGLGNRAAETYRRFVVQDHVRFALRAIADSGEDGLVVDVGCGGGLFLQMLAQHGHAVLGIDFSLDAASVAWHGQGVPAVCADFLRPPLEPACCCAITMFHVLEHLYDPAGYLDTAYRLLKPQGRLIVQVPNASSWQFLLLGECWSGLDVPRHLFDFRERDLEILLDSCGFQVLRKKHFSLRDNPASLATSLAPWLDPMARRIRRISESPRMQLFKDLAYLALVAASVPFAALEAACQAGSTIMMEARKK